MKKTLAYTVLTTAMAAGMALGTGGVANAAHCVNEEGTSPGFSYFGQEGRESTAATNASNCRSGTDTAPPSDPSERAPGQNR